MSQLVKVVSAGIVVAGIFSGVALMPSPAEAVISQKEKALLRQSVTECKAEAKEQKIKWGSRRKYVKSCVIGKLKAHPGVDADELLRTYPDLDKLPKADVRNPV
jgi:hypothetical protein